MSDKKYILVAEDDKFYANVYKRKLEKEGRYNVPNHDRPVKRADCIGGCRPCPYVGCKFNTYLDVNEKGGIRFNWPGKEPHEVPADQSCVLDMIDRPQKKQWKMDDEQLKMNKLNKLSWVAERLNYCSRQNCEQIEQRALRKVAEEIDDVWFR